MNEKTATHIWEGAIYRSLVDHLPDLFPPSEDNGRDYFSDLNGTHYDVISKKISEYFPKNYVHFELERK
jgi:hypothetical protein